jgi:hypothetical protein
LIQTLSTIVLIPLLSVFHARHCFRSRRAVDLQFVGNDFLDKNHLSDARRRAPLRIDRSTNIAQEEHNAFSGHLKIQEKATLASVASIAEPSGQPNKIAVFNEAEPTLPLFLPLDQYR